MDRYRNIAAAGGVAVLFLLIQFGALAMLTPGADAMQAVEDPTDPTNSFIFIAILLLATGGMLLVFKYGKDKLIHWLIIGISGLLVWTVLDILLRTHLPSGTGTAGAVLTAVTLIIPIIGAVGAVAGLVYYPEWYVIDVVGVILGAGAVAIFGSSFGPLPAVIFLILLAVYDAISVYGTKHMLTLADNVMKMRVPVMLVVPTRRSFSLRDLELDEMDHDDHSDSSEDSSALSDDAETPAEESNPVSDADEETTLDPDCDDTTKDALPETDKQTEPADRNAIFIGLGDAVMPSILIVSSLAFHGAVGPGVYSIGAVALNLPAIGTLLGTLVGLAILLAMVLRGRAHAGLPLLNGGAIIGFFLGAYAAGLTPADALLV